MAPLDFKPFTVLFFLTEIILRLAIGQEDEVTSENLVTVNEGIAVPFGRSVFVDPTVDLNIQVGYGDRCTVRVIENEPLSQRPGKLTPTNFPCQFGSQDVQYSHFGAKSPATDKVKLLLRYDSREDTLIVPVIINVQVLFEQLEIVTKNLPLTVDKVGSSSNPIDSRTLQFAYDKNKHDCRVTILSSFSGQPRYGELLNDSSSGQSQDCEDFVQAGIRYKHNPRYDSPNRDFVPMVVELVNASGEVAKQEYFQVMVRIKEGKENTPPQLSFSALLLMDVNQFVMTALTPNILIAEDAETNDDDLIFNITSPLGYEEGMIVSTDDQNLPITSFYQRDLDELKIAYKPPAVDSDSRQYFSITMEVIDSEGESSEPFSLTIVVNPMNTHAPIATRNGGLVLFEGQSRRLESSKNLEISDEDNIDEVTITVVGGLRHGKLLLLGTPVEKFSPADLDAGIVVYEHDGSNTFSDNIIFSLDDGKEQVEFLFPVVIYPEDDDAPILNVNTGLTIARGEEVEITPFILSATDFDSDDSFITFDRLDNTSKSGDILKKQLEEPSDPENWNYRDGMYERNVTSWTQQDLLEGSIYYKHNGEYLSQPVVEKLQFIVKDDNVPPNESDLNEFFIRITPVDNFPPQLFPGTSLQMTANENQLTVITNSYLRFMDLDTKDSDLVIRITRPPFNTDLKSTVKPGKIVYSEHPETEVKEFTQSEINHHKIAYQPADVELGMNAQLIQFEFEVVDVAGNTLPDQKFVTLLRPVDNKPPIVQQSHVDVFENGLAMLTPTILDATDVDTDPNLLTFTIKREPSHGTLQMSSVDMNEGDTFTKSDIANGLISYVNSGFEANRDDIKLEVSDGIHTVPITMPILIKNIDDQAPTFQLIPGTGSIEITVEENGRTALSDEYIRASDPDTDDSKITFLIEDGPKLGVIEVNGIISDRFKQLDLRNGKVIYVHNGEEIGVNSTIDSFNLTVSDMSSDWIIGGNAIDNVYVSVQIIPVDNAAPEVNIGDPILVLEGTKTAVTSLNLNATDMDTAEEDIFCTLMEHPAQGYLENESPFPGSQMSRSGNPISVFTITDIVQEHISYIQSIHRNVEPLEDAFTVSCSDGINTSPETTVTVIIQPTNDEAPELYMREFIVMEGNDLIIDLPILNAVDMDIPRDRLVFFITKNPAHGLIASHLPTGTIPVQNFTLDRIARGSTIVYQHDDSETTKDSFELTVTDGKYNDTKTALVIILPVDDETPRLVINDGLEIGIGDSKHIDSTVLKAEDLDSDYASITYVVREHPKHGYLTYLDYSGTNYNITRGMNFTQLDIDNNLLVYTHYGTEGVRDVIKFDLTDGFNPFVDRHFWISVESVDTIYPEVISKSVEVPENGKAPLTTDVLSASDSNSDDSSLLFTVTRTPMKGHLENTDELGVPITSFSQLDLAGNKIFYVHTSDDEVKTDGFEFEVSDGNNFVFRNFRITITDVDNKMPIIYAKKLRVKEGGVTLITPFELRAVDVDTNEDKIQFTITQFPINGKLMKGKYDVASTFTMADIMHNMISYHHDGSETSDDSFSYVVTDGTNRGFFMHPNIGKEIRKPVNMEIEVVPVDNIIPQLVLNKGASWLSPLDNGDLGFRLNRKVLLAEDRDSPDYALSYIITEPPQHGILIHKKNGNDTISNFTQGDIDKMHVYYILSPETNATSDQFQYKVVDPGKNELPDQIFRFNWAWIKFERDFYEVNEKEGFLEITVLRRGYLGETAFVGISLKNGTAVEGSDFSVVYSTRVQLNPGQSEAKWGVKIIDDTSYEKDEVFEIELEKPSMALLEEPTIAAVLLVDEDDESVVYIPSDVYEIEESIGAIFIPIKRKGDISKEMMVICYTESGSASGTTPGMVHSHSDFISRREDHTSMIHFPRGEDMRFCKVAIIDDSLFENEESFDIRLAMSMGGRLGNFSKSKVKILQDFQDAPLFYFRESQVEIDEGVGYFEIPVLRSGTDLGKPATVTVQSRSSNPLSAEVGIDYIGIDKNLYFGPGTTTQTFRVNILDDRGHPIMEGPEIFEIALRKPMNALLGTPDKVTIIITDSSSDSPRFQFKESEYEIEEHKKNLTTIVLREGDLSLNASIRCYTRQVSAKAGEDFQERPNTSDSLIIFEPHVSERPCSVQVIDDNTFEPEEEFRLVLGSPQDSSFIEGVSKGEKSNITIKIKDTKDKPTIQFEKTRHSTIEPQSLKEYVTVKVLVIRTGDLSKTSVVRVHTKDGSAKSGSDYVPYSKELEFGQNVSRHVVELEILYDTKKEHREALSLHLKPDKNMIAEIKNSKAIIYIQEANTMADVTFPTRPMVVSLKDYDYVTGDSQQPIPGYPVVCLTPCNPKHPEFPKTGALCSKEGINDSLTTFRWRVAAANGRDGVSSSELKDLEAEAFFAGTYRMVLDSIYFAAGSKIQCAARAVGSDGDPGIESYSNAVAITTSGGLCTPKLEGLIGAEPFSAKMRYTGLSDPEYPNLIELVVTIPHWDGMLPVISTRKLTNFELILSQDAIRFGTHKCSNLLDHDEVRTKYGFLTNATKNPDIVGEVEPYQFSEELRGAPALRNLDLEACMWVFTTYYDMSELVDDCGGTITTDGQVLNSMQSYVSVRVPLFVSYVFHSPVARRGWQHNDLSTHLRLTFVYDTAILWKQGLGAPEDSQLKGYLYPTRMTIEQDGRLLVNFRTEPRFRGKFVLADPGTDANSMVISQAHPELTFSLDLVRSEPTYAQPEQEWQFVSDYAVRDYSGLYHIKLIPCTAAAADGEESTSARRDTGCNPRDPITFDLNVRFQQVSDPVPTEYSLNTELHLLRKRDIWLANPEQTTAETYAEDVTFQPGDTVYGRIMVDPNQKLGDSFFVNIEKCFLCTGVDGYVPRYDPNYKEFGCVGNSPQLLHTFKIIDKGAPRSTTKEFRNIPFEAILASDDPDPTVDSLRSLPSADGFHFNSSPLFQVSYGRQWFIHCIYTVRSRRNAARGIGKRSVLQNGNFISKTFQSNSSNSFRSSESANEVSADPNAHSLSNYNVFSRTEYSMEHVDDSYSNSKRKTKRHINDAWEIGTNGLGTNMNRIVLDYSNRSPQDFSKLRFDGTRTRDTAWKSKENELSDDVGKDSSDLAISAVVAPLIALFVFSILGLFLLRRKPNNALPSDSPTVIQYSGHSRVVVKELYYMNSGDETEV